MSHNRGLWPARFRSNANHRPRLQNLIKNCLQKTVPVDQGPCAQTPTLDSLDQSLLNNYFDIDTLDLLNVTLFHLFVITNRDACAKTETAPLKVARICNFPTQVNEAFQE